MKTPFKSFVFAITLLLAGLSFAHEDPAALVTNTSKQLKDLLLKEDGNNTADIRKEAEGILYPRFDFLRMTALAVGRPWRSATNEQKDALIIEFRSLLTGTYFNTMLRYRDAEISIDQNIIVENEGKEATVKSSVAVKDINQPVSINYVLYKTEDGWKVFNVNVEGASLVTVYRNQFGEEINKGGIQQLIDTLKAKNVQISAVAISK